MECPFCKKSYDDEFNFCPWCGSEKPEINYDEDLESFEKENDILEEETIGFEKEFRDIGKELESLQEDIKNYENWKNDNNEELKIHLSDIFENKDYDNEELETIYSNIFDEEEGIFDARSEDSSSEIRCPNCGSKKFLSDYDRGEIVCTRCGLLVSEHLLDMGRPWFYTNEKNSREHLKFY